MTNQGRHGQRVVELPTEVPLPSPPRTTRERLMATVRLAVLLVVVLIALWAVVSRWDEVSQTLRSIPPIATIPSFLAIIVGVACATMSWQVFLDDLGPRVGIRRGAEINLVGQLGKYVPGSLWAYLLQMELGRRFGVARARVFAATLFSLAVVMVAALLTGSMVIPQFADDHPRLPWLYALLPIGIVTLHPKVLNVLVRLAFRVLRRVRPDHDLGYSVVVRSLLWAVGSYACFGTHLWLLARTQGGGFSLWPVCIGAMALGMSAGVFAFLVPSGVGVREAILITALASTMETGQALAYALVSRVMFIVADLVVAGGATVNAMHGRRRHGTL